MTTKQASPVKLHQVNSVEKKVYNLVESLQEFIPTDNDRNRLAYSLFKYLGGEGDAPEISLKSSKVKIVGIDYSELAQKLTDGLKEIK